MAKQVVLSIPPLVSTIAERELEAVESVAAEMEGTAGCCIAAIIAKELEPAVDIRDKVTD
jgi:GTP-sensing pleiotropic transcriptional regulator CodY